MKRVIMKLNVATAAVGDAVTDAALKAADAAAEDVVIHCKRVEV